MHAAAMHKIHSLPDLKLSLHKLHSLPDLKLFSNRIHVHALREVGPRQGLGSVVDTRPRGEALAPTPT